MKATIWRLSQRTGGWCEPAQKKNLSTFGVGGESHGEHPLACVMKRSERFADRNFPIRMNDETSGNMGGNAEDLAFRPMQEALGRQCIGRKAFCLY